MPAVSAAALTSRSSQNGADVGSTGFTSPLRRDQPHSSSWAPATRTNAARSHGAERGTNGSAAPQTVAITGGTHQLHRGPVSAGSDMYCTSPTTLAAAPTVTIATHSGSRRRGAAAASTSSTPITPPAIAGHGEGEATSVMSDRDLGRHTVDRDRHDRRRQRVPRLHVGWRLAAHPVGAVVVPRPGTAVTDDLPVGLGVRVGLRRQLGDARAVPVVVRGRRVAVLVHDTVGVDPQVRLAGVALDLRRRDRGATSIRTNESPPSIVAVSASVSGRTDTISLRKSLGCGGVGERRRRRRHDDDRRRHGDRQTPVALVAARRLVIEQLVDVGREVVDAHAERPRQHDVTGVVDGVQQGRVGDLDLAARRRC